MPASAVSDILLYRAGYTLGFTTHFEFIRSDHTMVAGGTSWRVEFGDQVSGRWVTDDPRLSSSVSSIEDCRKVARLSVERQLRRLG